MVKKGKTNVFEQSGLTVKLLVILALMIMGTAYLTTLSPSKITLNGPIGEIQTQTYLNASEAEREKLEITESDFNNPDFEVRLINVGKGKVLMVLNGEKLKPVSSIAYIEQIKKHVVRDKTPTYYVLVSYFIASLSFYADSISLIVNSEGVWYNELFHRGSTSLAKKMCTLLVKSSLNDGNNIS